MSQTTDALKSVASWLERWAIHACDTPDACTCGLAAVRADAERALQAQFLRPSPLIEVKAVDGGSPITLSNCRVSNSDPFSLIELPAGSWTIDALILIKPTEGAA